MLEGIINASSHAPTAAARYSVAAGKFVSLWLYILAKISLDNVASLWRRTVSGVLLVTEKEQNGHGRCSRPSPPSCRAVGLGSVCTDVEWSFYRWTLRTGLTATSNNNSTGRDWSTWCSHFNKRIILISGLDLSATTITMSDQNYYWTVLPSYKTSFVTGAMMKRSKG